MAEPVISPNGGTFVMVASVTLSCATPGARLRYTTDGSVPTERGGTAEPYSGFAFLLDAGECRHCTVKVRAFHDAGHFLPSPIASADFEVEPRCPNPVLAPAGGTFVGHVDVVVGDAGDSSGGLEVRWTTDPDASLGTGEVGASGKASDGYAGPIAAPGDTIRLPVAAGSLGGASSRSDDSGGDGSGGGVTEVVLRVMAVRPGHAASAVVEGSFVVVAQAAAVVFDPAYDTPQLPGAYLSMATSTPGATIYYTTDGLDPVVPGSEGGRHGGEGGGGGGGGRPRPVSPTQRSCAPGLQFDGRCAVHCDNPGTTTYSAVAVALPGFVASAVTRQAVVVEARVPAPRFVLASSPTPPSRGSGSTGGGGGFEEPETFTGSVVFSFAVGDGGGGGGDEGGDAAARIPGLEVAYTVAGASDERGVRVPPGLEVTWASLGPVTIRAVASAPGFFESIEVSRSFTVVEPLFDVSPAAVAGRRVSTAGAGGKGGEGGASAMASEVAEVDAWDRALWGSAAGAAPGIALRPFARSLAGLAAAAKAAADDDVYDDDDDGTLDDGAGGGAGGGTGGRAAATAGGCDPRLLTGRFGVLDYPGRFLSVLAPASQRDGLCGGGDLASATAARYRHPSALAEAASGGTAGATAWPLRSRPLWRVRGAGQLSAANVSALRARAWAAEAAWQAAVALPPPPDAVADGSEAAPTPAPAWSGCVLALSGGLAAGDGGATGAVAGTTDGGAGGGRSAGGGCAGHVVSDGVVAAADDLGERLTAAGVRRAALGVDFGLTANGSAFVVGFVPRAAVAAAHRSVNGSSDASDASDASGGAGDAPGEAGSAAVWPGPFSQLVTAAVWLVRGGRPYVRESFAHAGLGKAAVAGQLAAREARLVLGHDGAGRLVLLQVDGVGTRGAEVASAGAGENSGAGATLDELSALAVELGCVQAVALPSGARAALLAGQPLEPVAVGGTAVGGTAVGGAAVGGAAVDAPPVNGTAAVGGSCAAGVPAAEGLAWGCEARVSSVLCVHAAPPPVFEFILDGGGGDDNDNDDDKNDNNDEDDGDDNDGGGSGGGGVDHADPSNRTDAGNDAGSGDGGNEARANATAADPRATGGGGGGGGAGKSAVKAGKKSPSAPGLAYGWPWSPAPPPTPLPTAPRGPSAAPSRRPTASPSRVPAPLPSHVRHVSGWDDDYWHPHGGGGSGGGGAGFDELNDGGYGPYPGLGVNGTQSEEPDLVFYRTSTSMLVLVLSLSFGLHLWTWAAHASELEKRDHEHRSIAARLGDGGGGDDDFEDLGPDGQGRYQPSLSYGGATYGTKKPASEVAAALRKRLAAKLGKRFGRKAPKGYSPVEARAGEFTDDGGEYRGYARDDGQFDEFDRGSGSGIGRERGRRWRGGSGADPTLPTFCIDDVDDDYDGGNGGSGEEDEVDDEDFEAKFRRLDRQREAASGGLGMAAAGMPGSVLGGLARLFLGPANPPAAAHAAHAPGGGARAGPIAGPPSGGAGGGGGGGGGAADASNPFSSPAAGAAGKGAVMHLPHHVAAAEVKRQLEEMEASGFYDDDAL